MFCLHWKRRKNPGSCSTSPRSSLTSPRLSHFEPSLQARILKGIVICPLDNRPFLPESSLDEIITKESIRAELSSAKLPLKLSDDICIKAMRVFAILVYIDMVPAIKALCHEGFSDEYLPVDLIEKGGRSFMVSRQRGRLGAKTFRSFGNNSLWTLKKVTEFSTNQWIVQSPVFEDQDQVYNLDKRCPLPFISFGSTITKSFSSTVYDVRIHYAHQHIFKQVDGPGCEPRIAIKELISSNPQAFRIESETLSAIRKLNHPHLIKVIATYKRGASHCFMFPWADGGNLRDFWKRENPNSLLPEISHPGLFLWVLQQMYGLAQGLEALHNYGNKRFGRHGDLKPENILLFKDLPVKTLGTLRIADVGLAKFHDVATSGREDNTRTARGTRMYEPPETEITDGPRSRKYDIWSIGCIFLEFIVWFLYSNEGVEDFRIMREGYNFYVISEMTGNYEPSKAQIHPEVSRWIKNISDDPRCKEAIAFQHLLTLIRTRLLKVRVSDRAEATELREELGNIVNEAECNPPNRGHLYPPFERRAFPESPSSLSLKIEDNVRIPL